MEWNGMEWNGMEWNGMERTFFLLIVFLLPHGLHRRLDFMKILSKGYMINSIYEAKNIAKNEKRVKATILAKTTRKNFILLRFRLIKHTKYIAGNFTPRFFSAPPAPSP